MSMNKQKVLLTAAMAVGVLAVAPLHASAEEQTAETTATTQVTTTAEQTTTTAEQTTTTTEQTTTTAETTASGEQTTTTAQTTTTGTKTYLTPSKQITKEASGKAYYMDGDKKSTGRFVLSPNFPMGDLDHNKSVNAEDAIFILNAAAKSGTESSKPGQTLLDLYKDNFESLEQAVAFADINEDGIINAEDATLVLIHASRVGTNPNENPIGSAIYWADADGYLQTGFIKDEVTGKTYYAGEDFKLVTSSFEADGKKYNVESDGSVVPVQAGWKTENGKSYYYDNNGNPLPKGWAEIEGKKYWINADGSAAMSTWAETDKGTSYFDAEGAVQKGWIKLADGSYYSDADGLRMTGLIPVDNKYYFFSPDNGKMQTGWVNSEEKWRYFNENGVMQVGWLDLDGAKYYIQPMPDGTRVSGLKKIDNYIFYFDPESGKMQTGFVNMDGGTRYFSELGRLQADWMDIDGAKYYIDPKTYFVSYGLKKIGDGYYYFDPQTGKMVTGSVTMENGVRFFGTDGKLYAGWMTDAEGNYFYFKNDGYRAAGPLVIDEEAFFFDPATGVLARGCWSDYDGKKYYSSESGRLFRAWHLIDGQQYFFNTDYTMATGWVNAGGNRYYFNENGVMVTNTAIDGWYLTEDGHAVIDRAYQVLNTYGKSVDALAKYVYENSNYSSYSRSRSPEELPNIGYSYLAYYGFLGGTVTSEYVAAELDYLLREAGYTSIIMYENTSTGYHYWNQVKLDNGWYNYDATKGWFKKTDAEITKLGGYTSSPLNYISNNLIEYN